MTWPSARHKTAEDEGYWTPDDMNGVQDQYVRDAGIEADDLELAVVQAAGLTTTASGEGGAAKRRGFVAIATEESRTSTSYGTLTTPDQIDDLVVPANGLIAWSYAATWKNSVAGAGSVALFLNSNQLKIANPSVASPQVMETALNADAGTVYKPIQLSTDGRLSTAGKGSGTTAYDGDVTTGQANYVGYLFLAAGTYDLSIRYKSSSGSVTVKDRKLWAKVIGFPS